MNNPIWMEGKPEFEGIYFACFRSPWNNEVVHGELSLCATGELLYFGEPVQEIYGWLDSNECPFAPKNEETDITKFKKKILEKQVQRGYI